jgi:predicted dehydrogenase
MIIYGTKRTIMLDLSGNAMYELGYASSGKITYARGMGLLKQSLRIFSSLVNNAAKVATRRFRTSHEILIQEFAKSVLNRSKPPIDPLSAYESVKVLERITNEIDVRK